MTNLINAKLHNVKTKLHNGKVDVYSEDNRAKSSIKKIRPLLDLIKQQSVGKALHILNNVRCQKTAHIVTKIINAAVANGVHNKNYLKENLYLSIMYVTKAKGAKWLEPRARGSSNIREKHWCKVYIGLQNRMEVINQPKEIIQPQDEIVQPQDNIESKKKSTKKVNGGE